MNVNVEKSIRQKRDQQIDQILKVAIFAVGGQGGGVLSNWIIDLAERSDYDVQATSVAGVAQRTGATIYYLEMLPNSGRRPVFSLAPVEHDVDVLIAAELMEAGRAATRGFIAPGRTKIITSTHRQFATVEKVVPGNGISGSGELMAALQDNADELIAFDMQKIADEEGTVISAALFGAIAGSGALPFETESYRDAIRASRRGVEKSLAAFERAYTTARDGEHPAESGENAPHLDERIAGPKALMSRWDDLQKRVSALPEPVREMARAGLRKTIEFQDPEYGAEYLDRLERLIKLDAEAGGESREFAFCTTAAKYLANAMAYDDVIRVADVKTRAGRMDAIKAEINATSNHLVKLTEHTHPGATEVVSLLPARLGKWVAARQRLMRLVDRIVNRGRHIRTDRIGGFLSLYLTAGQRRWRRSLLRHETEQEHIGSWLSSAEKHLGTNYGLAVEIIRARRLIMGYSDTHARGLSKFDRVMAGIALVETRDDAAEWAGRLIEAALKDANGETLGGALQTISSFTQGDAAEVLQKS